MSMSGSGWLDYGFADSLLATRAKSCDALICRELRGPAGCPTRSFPRRRYSQNRWREREMIRTYGPPGQRGLPSRKILIRHVLRNASAPALTVLGMQFVGLLGGAVIVEQIFGLPGIGSMAVKYTTRGDIPIIMGLVMVTVIGVIIINLLVDIVIGWLNPKARVA